MLLKNLLHELIKSENVEVTIITFLHVARCKMVSTTKIDGGMA